MFSLITFDVTCGDFCKRSFVNKKREMGGKRLFHERFSCHVHSSNVAILSLHFDVGNIVSDNVDYVLFSYFVCRYSIKFCMYMT